MIHTSTPLILPCWSSRVGAAVGSMIHTLNCTWVRLLLWTPVSKMPILPTHETGSACYGTLSNIVSLRWWRCRMRSLEVGVLNLSLGSLKSLSHSLHSVLSNLLTWAEIRSLRGRTNTNSRVAPLRSSELHLPFLLHDPSSIFMD
jgi:hypothetical protein